MAACAVIDDETLLIEVLHASRAAWASFTALASSELAREASHADSAIS